jgi:methylated-DNA-[protein]-cysteine S-methyltransferase
MFPNLYGELTATPIGPVYLQASPKGVTCISLFQLNHGEQAPLTDEAHQAFKHLTLAMFEVNQYLEGSTRVFSFPLDLGTPSSFQASVLAFAQTIPYGEYRTYAQIARAIGKPGASQAVGYALSRNPLLLAVPCHRVVGSDGSLHGFAAPDGIKTKAWLLSLEGIKINGECVI